MSDGSLPMAPHSAMTEASPFAIPSKKLAMWLFILSDAVTFAALLFAYGYVRNASPNWPGPFHLLPNLVDAILMTLVLVTSCLTMLIAVRAALNGDKATGLRWTMFTLVGGLIFALLQLREWLSLIGAGLRLFQNPWGSSLFGAAFFSITGVHLAHIVAGMVALLVVGIGYKRGRYRADDIEIWGLFWQFQGVVWMFVMPLVYLLNLQR